MIIPPYRLMISKIIFQRPRINPFAIFLSGISKFRAQYLALNPHYDKPQSSNPHFSYAIPAIGGF